MVFMVVSLNIIQFRIWLNQL